MKTFAMGSVLVRYKDGRVEPGHHGLVHSCIKVGRTPPRRTLLDRILSQGPRSPWPLDEAVEVLRAEMTAEIDSQVVSIASTRPDEVVSDVVHLSTETTDDDEAQAWERRGAHVVRDKYALRFVDMQLPFSELARPTARLWRIFPVAAGMGVDTKEVVELVADDVEASRRTSGRPRTTIPTSLVARQPILLSRGSRRSSRSFPQTRPAGGR